MAQCDSPDCAPQTPAVCSLIQVPFEPSRNSRNRYRLDRAEIAESTWRAYGYRTFQCIDDLLLDLSHDLLENVRRWAIRMVRDRPHMDTYVPGSRKVRSSRSCANVGIVIQYWASQSTPSRLSRSLVGRCSASSRICLMLYPERIGAPGSW